MFKRAGISMSRWRKAKREGDWRLSMPDLSTTYLGLNLKNPLVPSSSPLCRDLGLLRQMEDSGAAAVVLHSLFEEQITLEGFRPIPRPSLLLSSFDEDAAHSRHLPE